MKSITSKYQKFTVLFFFSVPLLVFKAAGVALHSAFKHGNASACELKINSTINFLTPSLLLSHASQDTAVSPGTLGFVLIRGKAQRQCFKDAIHTS